IRAGLFPLLVDRAEFATSYVPALEAADRGDLAPLVRYFSTCQERMLAKAISEAEAAIGPADDLAAILAAAKKKVGERRPEHREGRARMAARFTAFQKELRRGLEALAKKVRAEVPGVKARVSASSPSTEHGFLSQ